MMTSSSTRAQGMLELEKARGKEKGEGCERVGITLDS